MVVTEAWGRPGRQAAGNAPEPTERTSKEGAFYCVLVKLNKPQTHLPCLVSRGPCQKAALCPEGQELVTGSQPALSLPAIPGPGSHGQDAAASLPPSLPVTPATKQEARLPPVAWTPSLPNALGQQLVRGAVRLLHVCRADSVELGPRTSRAPAALGPRPARQGGRHACRADTPARGPACFPTGDRGQADPGLCGRCFPATGRYTWDWS